MHAEGGLERGGGEVLRARLARRSRDPHHDRLTEPVTRVSSERGERPHHVVDPHERGARGDGEIGRFARDDRDRRAVCERVTHELVTVARRLERDEARAR
jgi:hypothetical protein